MKAIACVVLGSILALAAAARADEFGWPVGGEPWYFVKATLDATSALGPGRWAVTAVRVNGRRARDFALFQAGQPLPSAEVDGTKPFEAKIRWSWEPRQACEIAVDLTSAASGKAATLTSRLRAPARRGGFDPAWKNYLALVVSEDHGLERTGVPVHATFGVLSSYLKSPDEIRLVRAERRGEGVAYAEVPFQVYDVRVWNDPKILSQVETDAKTGARVVRYHPTTTFSLAFLADLKPREKATYLVFYNNPGAPKPSFRSSLRVSGRGLGKTIDNAAYKAVLHPKSGTVYEVYEKSTGARLEHKLETNGSVHWNPDVYSPPHAWYHCSDWESPPYAEESGPVFYSLRREAPLPFPKGVRVAITYYFYDRSPYIFMESVLRVEEDIFVMALRNAELVFNKAVFDKAAWRTVDGRLQTLDFAASALHPKHAAVLRPDTPWVAFYGAEAGVGFASLFLEQALPNLRGGETSRQQPYIYLQNGPWYYMSRGYVYSFASNNQTRMLPVRAGSTYYERNAWLPFAFRKDKGFAAALDAAAAALRSPLGLSEDIETYAESPDGWVVPLLTEPFEEGVKGAMGGVKKK